MAPSNLARENTVKSCACQQAFSFPALFVSASGPHGRPLACAERVTLPAKLLEQARGFARLYERSRRFALDPAQQSPAPQRLRAVQRVRSLIEPWPPSIAGPCSKGNGRAGQIPKRLLPKMFDQPMHRPRVAVMPQIVDSCAQEGWLTLDRLDCGAEFFSTPTVPEPCKRLVLLAVSQTARRSPPKLVLEPPIS